ncbi:MAG TPA: hypothetical protein VJV78_34365 [Polyangiales bacterium]|nr:hypothetical protein [Polyangiales bacterium]
MTSKACSTAFPYLKPLLSNDESEVLELHDGNEPVLLDLSNGLLVAYLIDDDDRFLYVQKRDLIDAGLSGAELHALALENLGEHARSKMQVEAYGNVYRVLLEGNFEASLILLPELWDRDLARLLPHGGVAALPARDVLAFCDSESREGLAELRKVVDRVSHVGDHLLSEHLYQRSADGTWTRRDS